MKRALSILAITGILLQVFYSGIILMNYELNKEYIAKNLCENRNKPMMHCNGKCHLKKQLSKQEKQESNPFQNLKEKLEIRVCSLTTITGFPEFVSTNNEAHFNYLFFISKTSLSAIFHPPQAA